jgi:hypothetical protein
MREVAGPVLYCATIDIVPCDWLQVWLDGLLYVPDTVVVCDDSDPVTLMIVFPDVSVTVMLKLPLLLVVAVARKLFALMHILVGGGTLPVYAIDAPL